MLGDFLEISVSTAEILASMEFYERLGFRHAPVGETWRHPYAVMTDGRVALGLHQYEFPSPALTFVLPDLRTKLAGFEQLGIEFAFCKLADDEFNEAGFTDPDQQMITLLEARTYSPLRAGLGDSACGYFLEYRIGVRDCKSSCDFWERMGMVAAVVNEPPAHYSQVARSGLNLGLQARGAGTLPQLVFVNEQPDVLLQLLETRGMPFRQQRDHDGAAVIQVATPDSLELVIRDRE